MKNTVWHIFADGYDNFSPTRKMAIEIYRSLDINQYPNARVYFEKFNDEKETVFEEYRWGRGEYPC